MNSRSSAVIASDADLARESFPDGARGNVSWFTYFSSDRTLTKAMSAGVMDVPPNGGALEPHRHDQAEIYFVAEGEGLLTVDGATTRIVKGMSAFIPGDAEHSLRNETSAPMRIFYVFPTDSFGDVVYRFSSNPKA